MYNTIKEIFATERQMKKMKTVLAFGDSNTWGLIPGTNKRYSFSERWTGLVQQKGKNLRIIE